MGVRILISGGSTDTVYTSQSIITVSPLAFFVGPNGSVGTLIVDTLNTIVSETGDVAGTAALRVFNTHTAGQSFAALEVGAAGVQAGSLTARATGAAVDRVTLATNGAWDLLLAYNNITVVDIGSGQMVVRGDGTVGNILEIRTNLGTLKASVDDAGQLNAQAYLVANTPGVSFSGPITNLTVVNGIVTGAS